MVLHLFSKTKYPRHRNYGDASIPPPILYSSDTGIPLTVHSARPSSRSSIRSTGSIGSYGNRRASAGGLGGGAAGGVAGGAGGGGASGSGGSKGILVSTSRTGAARSAAILLISCHIAAVSKQNSRASSRHTSGAGCSQHSRDDLDDGGGGGGTGSGSGCRSCESTLSMNRHLQKQLNHQRHLLSFELSPARSRNQDRFRTLLGMNGIENFGGNDDEDDECGPHSIEPSTTVPHAHDAHAIAHADSDPAHPGAGGGGGGGGAGGVGGYGYSYGYGHVGVVGGYGDADTNGGDSSGGFATGAELHHLQIGALPTPASETPRFAVNQLKHQSSRIHLYDRVVCSFPFAFRIAMSMSMSIQNIETLPHHNKNKVNYMLLVSVQWLHPLLVRDQFQSLC
nr:RH68811p [Drosophila melanogaster]